MGNFIPGSKVSNSCLRQSEYVLEFPYSGGSLWAINTVWPDPAAALKNLGFKWPDRRITINLAPADVRKTGPVYDLPLLLAVLALAGGLEEPLSELLLSALACAGIALIMNAVALPLLLKFGAEKARMVSMALFLLVFAGFALLGLAADRGLALPAPPAWVLTALPGLLAILAVGGFALSYCIAQAIYARKEF